ncbi:glycosyltransferase [Ornithinimicrobium cerasi]|uniref:glycosyltransferase n=1 Tax=Ornithinimicrobium cerasi TaxID=2248773 RepID=UPI000EFE9985|nr:glycosyltransferase [Ornithinimicrobium cerasi]
MGQGRRLPVAIAHDYLTQRGGAERVVLALGREFPDAPIYTTLYDPNGTYPEFRDRTVVTGPLNRIGLLRADHRRALPLLAPVVSRTTVGADVVIASSSGWAHGFRTDGQMLVYCHNPARWLYQRQEYLGMNPNRVVEAGVRGLAPLLTRWDRRAAARASRYLANSSVVRDRVRAAYGIEAEVLPPPPGLQTEGEQVAHAELGDLAGRPYWLVVSRLLPYKNVREAIEAFRGRPEHLVVVGAGPEKESLQRALPPNVRLVSDLTDAQLRWAYAHASGLVAPSREDFGLTPLEANAWGLPVVALRAGGYLDTVVEGVNGVFFEQSTPSLISGAVDEATHRDWPSDVLSQHVARFGEAAFRRRIREIVTELQRGG